MNGGSDSMCRPGQFPTAGDTTHFWSRPRRCPVIFRDRPSRSKATRARHEVLASTRSERLFIIFGIFTEDVVDRPICPNCALPEFRDQGAFEV